MLFNLFGKKEKPAGKDLTDITFLSPHAKEDAVLQYAKEHENVVFIAWFPDTLSSFKKLFTAYNEDENRITDARHFSGMKYPGKEIIFLEHHPLREKEEQLVQNLEQQKFTVYNSLTEPLFIKFGSERIIELMTKMGAAENEALQHELISRSVKNAQQKIAKKLLTEQPAASQQEWMDRNS